MINFIVIHKTERKHDVLLSIDLKNEHETTINVIVPHKTERKRDTLFPIDLKEMKTKH